MITNYTMIEVIFKIFLTDYIDFQGFITKRIQKPLLIEYKIFKLLVASILNSINSIFWAMTIELSNQLKN